MASISVAKATELLDLWLGADAAVASGQSYSIGNRSLTRADAADITEKIKFYADLCDKLSRGGTRVQKVIPRDI